MERFKQLYEQLITKEEHIAIVGLGYVGLPLALAFAKQVKVIGYDTDHTKIVELKQGIDRTGYHSIEEIKMSEAVFTSDISELGGVKFFIIAVPTPVQGLHEPDLKHVQHASEAIGQLLSEGAIVVYESTVYPGVTEEICIPILEQASQLRCGIDFKVGYSPERINPGDEVHRLENITKIVAAIDELALETVANVYELIIKAGVFRAESIKVAEAAKVVENAQRDVNIAFMNELAMIFNDMKINTQAVLEAAATKWNFLNFTPGLVGGHCISIDPYYLTYKAELMGHHAELMLAARQINENMGQYVAQQVIKKIIRSKQNINDINVGILGLAYKEDCNDIRNSKVIDVINELQDYGITPVVCDPLVDHEQVAVEHGIDMLPLDALQNLHVIIVAVPHEPFKAMTPQQLLALFGEQNEQQTKILIDVKSIYDQAIFEQQGVLYWSL